MKKIKKALALILAGIMCVGLTACESSSQEPSTNEASQDSGDASASSETKTIYLYQMKIEIDESLKNVAKKYEESHPGIKIKIESSSDNYATSLKTKFTGGEAPDIFTVVGYEDAKMWSSNLEDLSDQPWAENMIDLAKEGITIDNAVYGMPVSVEGFGYMYNKNLFEKAGITEVPKTVSSFKQAVDKLEAAGIQPLTEPYMDWYQAGNFMVNIGIARQEDPMAFIKGLNDGSQTFVGNKTFEDLANFLLYDVSKCASPYNTDFNTQTSTFSNQEVAITLGGNWNQPTLDAAGNDIHAGLMPFPIDENEASNDMLYVGVTGYWGVNKDSKVKDEAKEFLAWLATTPEGQACMTKDLQLIPAFSNKRLGIGCRYIFDSCWSF